MNLACGKELGAEQPFGSTWMLGHFASEVVTVLW